MNINTRLSEELGMYDLRLMFILSLMARKCNCWIRKSNCIVSKKKGGKSAKFSIEHLMFMLIFARLSIIPKRMNNTLQAIALYNMS